MTTENDNRGKGSKTGKLWGWLIVACLLCFACLLTGPFERQRHHGGPRSPCKKNLKLIGLALHNYHDTYGCLPPAYVMGKDGKPAHSWRVLILPYLDQEELYEQYRFDEPWNGPNNLKLLEKVPEIYRCPTSVQQGEHPSSTNYVVVVGAETAWPGAETTAFRDLLDGLGQSILVVEVANSGIAWSQPDDLHFGEMPFQLNPPSGLGISSHHPGGAHVSMGDGSYRFVTNQIKSDLLRALIGVADGIVIKEF